LAMECLHRCSFGCTLVQVLVTEYILSTYTPGKHDLALIPEAYSMILALKGVLQKAGARTVVTVSRYLTDIVRFSEAVQTDEESYIDSLERLSKSFDLVIAIAPPLQLVQIADAIHEDKLLGPPRSIMRLLSSKHLYARVLGECGISVPQTISCAGRSRCDLSELDGPYVVKPSMLAGGEHVYIAYSRDDVEKLVDVVAMRDPRGYAVVQRYVEGVHGSISIVFVRGKPSLFSVNLQLVSVEDNRIVYHGNVLPLRSEPIVSQAKNVVNKLSKCLGGLSGYIGMDFVWNGEMVVVEVNPRFTTSGIGIAKLYPKLGEMMLGLADDYGSVYLGYAVSGYAYIVKTGGCTDSSLLEQCLQGLVVGTATSFEESLARVELLNPRAIFAPTPKEYLRNIC